MALEEDEKELYAGSCCQCIPGCLAQQPFGKPCYMLCRSSLGQAFKNWILDKKLCPVPEKNSLNLTCRCLHHSSAAAHFRKKPTENNRHFEGAIYLTYFRQTFQDESHP